MNTDLGGQDPQIKQKKKSTHKVDERGHKGLDMSDEEVKIKSASKLSMLENNPELQTHQDARISYRMSQKDLYTSREQKQGRDDSPEFPSIGYHLRGKTI